jgi:uncharacterized protein YcbX
MARVTELWRYPVKSCAGERIRETWIGCDGLRGDRIVQPTSARGDRVTARMFPRLLGLQGSIDEDGTVLLDGVPWNSEQAAPKVRDASAPAVELKLDRRQSRFDVLPVSLVTDGAVVALGVDRRRLRPNIVVGGIGGLAERDWVGFALLVGGAVLGVRQVRGRCVMTTFDPDTQEQDRSVLRRIVDDFGGRFALDCYVVRAGRVREGDPFELLGYWTLDRRAPSIQIGHARPAWIRARPGAGPQASPARR